MITDVRYRIKALGTRLFIKQITAAVRTSHWHQVGWKLSPVVFYLWLRLQNTTWLSFQPDIINIAFKIPNQEWLHVHTSGNSNLKFHLGLNLEDYLWSVGRFLTYWISCGMSQNFWSFPKLSASATVSGRFSIAVSGRRRHTNAPNIDNAPSTMYGRVLWYVDCNMTIVRLY